MMPVPYPRPDVESYTRTPSHNHSCSAVGAHFTSLSGIFLTFVTQVFFGIFPTLVPQILCHFQNLRHCFSPFSNFQSIFPEFLLLCPFFFLFFYYCGLGFSGLFQFLFNFVFLNLFTPFVRSFSHFLFSRHRIMCWPGPLPKGKYNRELNQTPTHTPPGGARPTLSAQCGPICTWTPD